jgi:hypothetical protein
MDRLIAQDYAAQGAGTLTVDRAMARLPRAESL